MVEWAMDSCRLGCLAAVYAQPFWLLLQLWLCAGYALLRLLNLHVQTEEEKSLVRLLLQGKLVLLLQIAEQTQVHTRHASVTHTAAAAATAQPVFAVTAAAAAIAA